MDWLSNLDTEAPPAVQEEEAAPIAPKAEDSLPAWLDNLQEKEAADLPHTDTGAAEDTTGISDHPFADESLLDWGDEAEDKEELDQAPIHPPAADQTDTVGELTDAHLPDWVQAMRPIQAMPTGKDISGLPVEKSGPLAGLRGVLPGEETVTQFRSPPAYPLNLSVTEKQRIHAALLEKMVVNEAKPRSTQEEQAPTRQRLGRLIIGFILILSILLPLLSGSSPMPPPTLFPSEVVAIHHQIANLPEAAPVLLAVEYEPGFSGEMRISALPVIEHLLAKKVRLATVSTVASGPILAEDLLATAAQASQPDYFTITPYINLGYMAGSTTSLQEFALHPQMATRYGFNLEENGPHTWEHQALQGINQLSDFALVIVLTDNPDLGRAWIEQVKPNLGETPLIVIASAQAAPLLTPYSESAQIQGILSGLAGAAAYEQLLQRPGSSQTYWDAYHFGIIIAICIILFGVLHQMIISPVLRSKDNKRT